jgi:thymidylate synthase ThyX
MSVKLIWITPEAENIISYCARVSNPSNQENYDTSHKLLKYCAKNKHWSVFEQASMCVEINTTRAISAQLIRHNTMKFQEFCIAEGSLITFEHNIKIPIETLYENRENVEFNNLNIKVYDEGTKTIKLTSIKEVFNTGLKECINLILENNNILTCTTDHKVYTSRGFLSIKECNNSDFIALHNEEDDTIYYERIMRIENVGIKQTYDIEVNHVSHNYMSNGIVTHNSQRYATVSEMGIEIPHLRRQDLKNRQSSIDDIQEVNDKFKSKIEEYFQEGLKLYNELIDHGVAKESARFILPMSTKTRLYMTGSIRSFIHYCQVRCDPSTQYEHRELAIQIKNILIEQLPCLIDILNSQE